MIAGINFAGVLMGLGAIAALAAGWMFIRRGLLLDKPAEQRVLGQIPPETTATFTAGIAFLLSGAGYLLTVFT